MPVIPPLPDLPRLTEYDPVASAGPFNVGFQLYGDGSDYSNWIEVWLDGVKKTPVTDYTLTSPSGSLASLPRPITDARITPTAVGGWTGHVAILGAQRPRRTTQLTEGVSIPARTINAALTAQTAVQREQYDLVRRCFLVPLGETGFTLPSAADRKGGVLGFDPTTGAAHIYAAGIGTGNVIGPAGNVGGKIAVFLGDGNHIDTVDNVAITADGLAVISPNAAGADAKTGLLLDRVYSAIGDSMRVLFGAAGTGIGATPYAAGIIATAIGVAEMGLDFHVQSNGSGFLNALDNRVMRLAGTGVGIGTGAIPSGVKLNIEHGAIRVTNPSNAAFIGSAIDGGGLTILDGTAASPVAELTASIMVNRHQAPASPSFLSAGIYTEVHSDSGAGFTTGGTFTAVQGGTSTTVASGVQGIAYNNNPASSSQPQGVIGEATTYGTGDALGVGGTAYNYGGGQHAAFGLFGSAHAMVPNTVAIGIETGFNNHTGQDHTYSPDWPSVNGMVGHDSAYYGGVGSNRGAVFLMFRANNGTEQVDVGIGFMKGNPTSIIRTADIQTDTSSGTILLANSGAHVDGINLTGTGTTYSGKAFKSPGFSVDGVGNTIIGTITTDLATLSVAGSAVSLGGFSAHAAIDDTTAMAAGVGAGIVLGGKYTSAGLYTPFAGIRGVKENGTTGDFHGALVGYVNDGATGGVEAFRFKSTKALQLAAYGAGLLHSDINGNITSSAIALGGNDVSGTLPATNGGTGNATYAVGDILYASTTTALAKLADVATGNVLISGGVGVAPSWGKVVLTAHIAATTANRLFGSDGSGNPSLITQPGAGLTIAAGALALANDLAAVENLSGTGLVRRTGSDAWSVGTTVTVAEGGTGLTSGTSGGILGYTAAGTLASSGLLTANAIVLGGGAGAAPATLGSLGTTTTVLHGNAGGAPTFGAVSLTADVSGILAGANGGTNNGFMQFSGPSTSLKTFTLPNASDTVACLGQAQTFTADQTIQAAGPNLIFNVTPTGGTASLSFRDAGTSKFQMGLQSLTDFFFYDNANAQYIIQYSAAAGAGVLKFMPTGGKVGIGTSVAIPAGGTQDLGIQFSSTAHFGVSYGSGAPTLSAAQGTIYLRSDGNGTANRAYININGSTGWTALTTAA